MTGFKSLYFRMSRPLLSGRNVSAMAARTGIPVIFPFYHVVSDARLPHIRHLYPYRNTVGFEQDLDFLLRHFEPLQIDAYRKNEYDPAKKYFILSFDDGLREMYHTVAPVLNRKGIPAIFFVNPAFIDNKQLFYRYTASLIIEHCSNPVNKKYHANEFLSLKKKLLKMGYAQRAEMESIAKEEGVDIPDFLSQSQPYLTLDELNKLSQMGFTIGAHSMDHPLYAGISLQEQERQTLESVRAVQEWIHPAFNYFAFPFTASGVDERYFRLMSRGPETHVHMHFGTAGLKKPNAGLTERIPMEIAGYSGEEIVRAELSYFLFKKRWGWQ